MSHGRPWVQILKVVSTIRTNNFSYTIQMRFSVTVGTLKIYNFFLHYWDALRWRSLEIRLGRGGGGKVYRWTKNIFQNFSVKYESIHDRTLLGDIRYQTAEDGGGEEGIWCWYVSEAGLPCKPKEGSESSTETSEVPIYSAVLNEWASSH